MGKLVVREIRHLGVIDDGLRLDRRATSNANTDSEPMVPATCLAGPTESAHKNAPKMDFTKESNGRHLNEDGKILSQEGEIGHHQ